jgi:hypothetical protein
VITIKNVLEELYFGDIQPNSQNYKENPQWGKALNVVNEIEEG